MLNMEMDTSTAGAYVYYDGCFVFMFGVGANHSAHELGVVRLGGHRERGESVMQCVVREVHEEASLDITFFDNETVYVGEKTGGGVEKTAGNQRINPILVLRGKEGALSAMYLAHGHGLLAPKMETQGILLLRREDVQLICAKETTFAEYKENGGRFLLASELPENAVLVPHAQVRFLCDLLERERDLIDRYVEAYNACDTPPDVI